MSDPKKAAAKIAAHKKRHAAWLQRQKAGEVVLPLKHVLDDTVDFLVAQGRLPERDRDDRAKVAAAFQVWWDETRAAFSLDASRTRTAPPDTQSDIE